MRNIRDKYAAHLDFDQLNELNRVDLRIALDIAIVYRKWIYSSLLEEIDKSGEFIGVRWGDIDMIYSNAQQELIL